MDLAEYMERDATALAALVRRGDVSADELLDAALERMAAVEPSINCVSQLFSERARASISEGLPDGPFRGVPFLLKDIAAALAGTPTYLGSRLCRAAPPDSCDSTLVERYKQAGVVIFGKTTIPEFGIAASTETSLTGATRNPWDVSRTPGGSSGGAAAAVASGIVPFAHATDGGGSLRTPASCCGLFGLKPTRARTPFGPLLGEGWGGLAVNHVLTRSVRDSAAVLDCTHGMAPGDPYCAPPVERPYAEEVGRDPGRLRIALQLEPFSRVAVDPECIAAAQATAVLLQQLGHHVEEAQPEVEWAQYRTAALTVVASNLRAMVVAANKGEEPAVGAVDNVVWDAVAAGRKISGEAYAEAISTIHMFGRKMAVFHATYDVLMSPTLAKPPVHLGPLHTDNPDLTNYRDALTTFSPFASPMNMSGQPSMSVPLHWTANGLPVGVMFTGRFGAEGILLQLAGQLETARPWAHRRPQQRSEHTA